VQERRLLSGDHVNKLLATNMDFSRISERASSEENFRSDTIRTALVVGRSMLEVT